MNKYLLAAAFVGSVITCDLITRPFRTQVDTLAQAFLIVHAQNHLMHNQLEYLVNVMNENDIELDEFDLIVLNEALQKD